MTKKKKKERYTANITGDGAIAQGSGAVAIGVSSIVQIGDGNIVGGDKLADAKTILERIKFQISNTSLPRESKLDLEAEVEELFEQMLSDETDEKTSYRKLRNIQRISPDILDIVITNLATDELQCQE